MVNAILEFKKRLKKMYLKLQGYENHSCFYTYIGILRSCNGFNHTCMSVVVRQCVPLTKDIQVLNIDNTVRMV